MSEINKEIEEGLASIFDSYTPVEGMPIKLPSCGRGYNLSEDVDSITISSLKFKDEMSLGATKKAEYTNALLSKCTDGIRVRDLFLFDKIFILLKLREISISSDYKVDIVCPECEDKYSINFELDKFPINEAEAEFDGTIKIHLPKIDKDCVLRLPRVRDERVLTSPDMGEHLYKFIDSIGEIVNSQIIRKAVPDLPIVDSSLIISTLIYPPVGVETNFEFYCQKCNKTEIMRMPISDDFFTLNLDN